MGELLRPPFFGLKTSKHIPWLSARGQIQAVQRWAAALIGFPLALNPGRLLDPVMRNLIYLSSMELGLERFGTREPRDDIRRHLGSVAPSCCEMIFAGIWEALLLRPGGVAPLCSFVFLQSTR